MSTSYLILAGFLLFASKRTLIYLHVFQQDEYDSKRFLPWLAREFAVDRKLTIAIAVCLVVRAFGLISGPVAAMVVALQFAVVFCVDANPLKTAKKPLVLTARAKRIYAVALLFSVIFGVALAATSAPLFLWLLPIHAIPLTLAVATWLLSFHEKKIQLGFWREAHEKVLQLKPTVIGITGSYGKTSVKHILGHILETQAPTLITPGSINTPMGISRVIREKLTRQHKYFLCEMGAYGPGSISRLCDLVPPQLGVIVSIGLAHHERFKTLDTVARTKFELAEATVKQHGQVVVAEDFLSFDYSRQFVEAHFASCVLVGPSQETGLKIAATGLSSEGVQANVLWQGKPFHLQAPLFGEHHAFNIAIAFAAACTLGVSPGDAIVALASTPQIQHRLEIKREATGQVVIDDAYNSNPVGFANALKLLNLFRKPEGR